MDGLSLFLNSWLDWQIRALVFSLVILLIASPVHWRSPLLRHWVLVTGVMALLCFPLMLYWLPTLVLPILPSQFLFDPFSSPVNLTFEFGEGAFWKQCLLALSLLIGIYVVARHFRAWSLLSKKILSARPPSAQIEKCYQDAAQEVGVNLLPVRLVLGDSNDTPCTLGWLRPVVLIPNHAVRWAPEDLRIVLVHELQHVKRRDWFWQQLVLVLLVLYPLNPLVWKIRRRVRGLAEESVDKLSLSLGISPTTYADTLLRQLRSCRQVQSSAAVHMQQRLDIAERVSSLIAEPYSWPKVRRANSLQMSALVLFLAVPFATLKITQMPVEPWLGELIELPKPIPEAAEPETDLAGEEALVWTRRPKITVIDMPESQPAIETADLRAVLPASVETGLALVPEQSVSSSVSLPVEPRPMYLVRPEYPASAIRHGKEATVEVVFDLNDLGEVINPRILYPSRRTTQFEEAALAAISASRYELDESLGQNYFRNHLTQTYVFELVDEDQYLESATRQPP